MTADDEEEDSDDESNTIKQNACSVAWEGKVLDRAFTDWKVCVREYTSGFYPKGEISNRDK